MKGRRLPARRESHCPMFRRRRHMRKLRRVARVLLELDSGANRLPHDRRLRHRSRAVFGRG